MRRPTPLSWCLAALQILVLLLLSSGTNVTAQEDYVLGPEDKIIVTVWDNPDLTTTTRISLDGKILFPLVGEVQAAGLTARLLGKHIAELLADGYLVDPHVAVEVLEYKSQQIHILGEVKTPGAYSLTKTMTLVEAISLAGGPTSDADRELMIIRPARHRSGPVMPDEVQQGEVIPVRLLDVLEGDQKQNILVRAGDTIYLPRVKVFYITGEVSKPGRYEYRKGMTVLDAISTGGGFTEQAAKKRVKILRSTKDRQRQESRVSMEDLIQPEDTIVVPESFF